MDISSSVVLCANLKTLVVNLVNRHRISSRGGVVVFCLQVSPTAPMAWWPVVSIVEKERPWRQQNDPGHICRHANGPRFPPNYPLKNTTVLYNLSTVGHFPIVNMPTSTHAVHAVHQTACHCLRISSMELDVKNILGSFQYSKVGTQHTFPTHHKGIGFHVGLWGGALRVATLLEIYVLNCPTWYA